MTSIFIITILIHSLLLLSPTKSNPNPNQPIFNVTLHHRTSPHLPASIRNPAAAVRHGDNENYVIEYWIGSSRKREYGSVDTGSHLVWLQCQPCDDCYSQHSPPYDPRTTTSSRAIGFHDHDCNMLEPTYRHDSEGACGYAIEYEDGAMTIGTLLRDTIVLQTKPGVRKTFPNLFVGCGHNNSGNFGEVASGIVGLNRNPLSLLSQIEYTKFSYCLPQYDRLSHQSYMIFGSIGSTASDDGLIRIPLVHIENSYNYHVSVTEIVVDHYRIPFMKFPRSNRTVPTEGNMYIDIGNTHSYIYERVFVLLVRQLQQTLGQAHLEGSTACFRVDHSTVFPNIFLGFGHQYLHLPTKNVFTEHKEDNDYHCLTLRSNTKEGYGESVTILGGWTQAHYMVGFNLDPHMNSVYFRPHDCT